MIDNQKSEPTFQCKTALKNGVVENDGTMTINAGTIDASNDSTPAAIYTTVPYGKTFSKLVINNVTLKNAKYGIQMQSLGKMVYHMLLCRMRILKMLDVRCT